MQTLVVVMEVLSQMESNTSFSRSASIAFEKLYVASVLFIDGFRGYVPPGSSKRRTICEIRRHQTLKRCQEPGITASFPDSAVKLHVRLAANPPILIFVC